MHTTLRTDLIRAAHDHPELRPLILPLVEQVRTAARPTRLKREVRLRAGEVIARGLAVTIEYDPSKPGHAIMKVQGRNAPVKVDTINLHEYLDGFDVPPSKGQMRAYAAAGEMAPSVTGLPVDDQGWARDGSPSWTLALKGRY